MEQEETNNQKYFTGKLRPLENYEGDFIEYFINRMRPPDATDDDKARTSELVSPLFYVLTMQGFQRTISWTLDVLDMMEEFEEKFGDRYTEVCIHHQEMLDKGELKSEPKSGCGNCSNC